MQPSLCFVDSVFFFLIGDRRRKWRPLWSAATSSHRRRFCALAGCSWSTTRSPPSRSSNDALQTALRRLAPSDGVGNVSAVTEIAMVDANTGEPGYVLPGFVDIHNHGLGGCDEVCDHWAYPDYSLRRLAHTGTLSVLASVIFSAKRPDATKAVIHTIESRLGKPALLQDDSDDDATTTASAAPSNNGGGSSVADNASAAAATAHHRAVGCVIEGIHAEGPLVADCGGLPPTDTDLSLEAFQALCALMPSMRIMTISPSAEAKVGFARFKHLLDIGSTAV